MNSFELIQTNLTESASNTVENILSKQKKNFLQKNNATTVRKNIYGFIKVFVPKLNEKIIEDSPFIKDLNEISLLLTHSSPTEFIEDFSLIESFSRQYMPNVNLTGELEESIIRYHTLLDEKSNCEIEFQKLSSNECNENQVAIQLNSINENEITMSSVDSDVLVSSELNDQDELDKSKALNCLAQQKDNICIAIESSLSKIYGYSRAILKMIKGFIESQESVFEELYEEYLVKVITHDFEGIIENLKLCNSLGIPLSLILSASGDMDQKSDVYIEMLDQYINMPPSERNNQFGQLAGVGEGIKSVNDDFIYYLGMFKHNKALFQLIESLGKNMGLDVSVEEHYEELYISSKTNKIVSRDYRERISGITFDKRLEYMLPQELALLSDPDVELLFELKFLENRITSFDLDSVSNNVDEEEKAKQSTRNKDEHERGPVIVCIDTSGSMSGLPSNYAKAVTFILSLKCLDSKRNIYIINFSDSIDCQKIDYHDKSKALADIKRVLSVSFNGGTDLDNAVEETINRMNSDKDFSKSDMLVCTDSYFNISDSLVQNALKQSKQKNNRFFELVVNAGSYYQPKQLFFNTIYAIDGDTLRVLDEQINEE